MEKTLICPDCGIELPEENFQVMAFLESSTNFWCPECGHVWEMNQDNANRNLK